MRPNSFSATEFASQHAFKSYWQTDNSSLNVYLDVKGRRFLSLFLGESLFQDACKMIRPSYYHSLIHISSLLVLLSFGEILKRTEKHVIFGLSRGHTRDGILLFPMLLTCLFFYPRRWTMLWVPQPCNEKQENFVFFSFPRKRQRLVAFWVQCEVWRRNTEN